MNLYFLLLIHLIFKTMSLLNSAWLYILCIAYITVLFNYKIILQNSIHKILHSYSALVFSLQLEKLIEKNYFLNKSANEGYKGYVRAYASHSLKNIFDVNTLDLQQVALSFGFKTPPFVDLSILDRQNSLEECIRESKLACWVINVKFFI